MVSVWPLNIVQVTTHEMIGYGLNPLLMIEHTEVVLELNVSEIVPVTDLRLIGKVLLKGDHFALCRHVLESGAGFYRKFDSKFSGTVHQLTQGLNGTAIVEAGDFLALENEGLLSLRKAGSRCLPSAAMAVKALVHFLGFRNHRAHVKH